MQWDDALYAFSSCCCSCCCVLNAKVIVSSSHFYFLATAQCLCAVADVLSFTLTHAISSALIGKICTAIYCLAILASAVACFCTQVDVISSTTFSSNARDFLRSQPFILLSLIGVLTSAACIPLNSSAALLSCCCFCGITCFLSGFPAAVPPQSHVVIRGDNLRAFFGVTRTKCRSLLMPCSRRYSI